MNPRDAYNAALDDLDEALYFMRVTPQSEPHYESVVAHLNAMEARADAAETALRLAIRKGAA